MTSAIVQIIDREVDAQYNPSLAEALRLAAWFVMEDYPDATAADFADAAASIGLHRQGATNRWNEARQNMELAIS